MFDPEFSLFLPGNTRPDTGRALFESMVVTATSQTRCFVPVEALTWTIGFIIAVVAVKVRKFRIHRYHHIHVAKIDPLVCVLFEHFNRDYHKGLI